MPKNIPLALALCVIASFPLQAAHATSVVKSATETPEAKSSARAFFVDLKNKAEVPKTFTVKFGVEGMKIAPAGIVKPGSGHFHLLIDTDPLTPEELKRPIPADMKHIHFGNGQTETNLTLTPGEHKLQIVMGDGAHKVHNPPVMSEVITVIVK